jgi:hypothetical protein
MAFATSGSLGFSVEQMLVAARFRSSQHHRVAGEGRADWVPVGES